MDYEPTKIPSSFSETVQIVEDYALEQIQQQTQQKQLYYHTQTHALAVKRRARIIFQAIAPYLEVNHHSAILDRIARLIDLCAISHDLVQKILPPTEANSSRKRPARVSELATIEQLTEYITNLNQKLLQLNAPAATQFNNLDLQIIDEAIKATICELDPAANQPNSGLSFNSIYQPFIYNSAPKLFYVANIIALADLGTLGMEGIEPYIHEGILIFLEENPDLVEVIAKNACLHQDKEQQNHITKKRLLKMARFMINLAQDRLVRFEQEIALFPPQAQDILQQKIFKYLTTETIEQIKELVPTEDNITLEELIDFFCRYVTVHSPPYTKLHSKS